MIMTMLEISKAVELFLKYGISKVNDPNKYQLTPLNGITNTSLIVEVDSKKFVLRIPGDNPDVINRESEKYNTALVQEIGMTLPYIIFDAENGIKISEYFEIYTYKDSDFRNSDLRNNAFIELMNLHKSDLMFEKNFSPLKVFSDIADISNPIEEESKELGLKIVKELEEIGINNNPCHQDLYCGNFVTYKDKTFLIDWEYSSMGDAYFDYADLFWQNKIDLDKSLKSESLNEIGIKTDEDLDKFEYFEILSMITWGLWALKRCPNDKDGVTALHKALSHTKNKKL